MKRLVDFKTEDDLLMMKLITLKLKEANIVGTLKQAIFKMDGDYDYIDIKQKVIPKGIPFFWIKENLFLVTIKGLTMNETKEFSLMYDNMLTRNKTQSAQEKTEDYLFVLDVLKEELDSECGYIISMIQPVYMSCTKSEMKFIFNLADVRVGVEE